MLTTVAERWLAGILFSLALFCTGLIIGHHEGANAVKVKTQAAQIVQQGAVIKHDEKVATAAATQASDATAIGVEVASATEAVHEQIKRIIVKVPVYIPAAADADCAINAGFVRVWNAANGASDSAVGAAAQGGQQSAGQAPGAGDVPASGAASVATERGEGGGGTQ